MAGLCRLAHRKGIALINDEIYERLSYGTPYVHPLVDAPETREAVITINGMSKAYAMTGWRIGFALGDEEIVKKINILQGHTASCACSVSQWASVGAVREAQDDVERMVAAYKGRMEYVYGELSSMSRIRVNKPQGAFYFFLDIRSALGKKIDGVTVDTDVAFCDLLLEHGVGMVPGSVFMAPGFVRMSYASSLEALQEGMALLRSFLAQLR
jgi:aspartate aminotransferase